MANHNGRPHVPEEELHAYCDGELSPAQRVEIAEHLLGCLICRAQHAEVESVRNRAASLLAVAVPVNVRRVAAPAAFEPIIRRRTPRIATAIAAAVVGFGVWFSLRPEITGPGAQLAGIGIPNLGANGTTELDSAAMRDRLSQLGDRVPAAPQVKALTNAPVIMAPSTATPIDVDPVFTSDWSPTSFDDARTAGGGSLAHVNGLPVVGVRMHPSSIGGRPTFMIRQRLQDGRAVWVFEGLEEDIAPVNQVLQASGIAVSMVTRTKPDYVGSGANVSVTSRMVTVVGYLPVDSLNALVSRVTLR